MTERTVRLARALALSGAASWCIGGCSPTLDWRTVRPAGSGAELLFPCKPVAESRPAALEGTLLSMTMVGCQAGGATFALAFAEVGQPGRAEAVLTSLKRAQADNLRAPAVSQGTLRIPGAQATPAPQRFRIDGRMPDGSRVHQHLVYFSDGTRVYQAAVLGAKLQDEAVATFFEAMQVVR